MVDAFSLKLQRDNRKNALAVDPAKGKNWKKDCIFHRTVEMKQPHTITEPINILKTICFSLSFFSGGLFRSFFLWNFKKTSTVSYGTANFYHLLHFSR